MATIKLDTGLKTYDIEDEHGNIRGSISFNTSDINFFSRAKKMQDKITAYINSIETLDPELGEDVILEIIEETDKNIKNELNTLFDSDVSSVVFGNQSCLNTLKGVTFVERFLKAFIPIIKKDFEKEMKSIDKYTSMKSE